MTNWNKYALVTGQGISAYSELESFDMALIDAGIGDYNLVRLSSILPPHVINSKEIDLSKGQILHLAFASKSTCSDEAISSAIAIALPEDLDSIGVIMENSGCQEKEIIEENAIKMSIRAMEKRSITVKKVISASIQAQGAEGLYTTTFAGICVF